MHRWRQPHLRLVQSLPMELAEQEIGCRGAAIWWRMENCCRDTDGNLVDCNRVDLEERVAHQRARPAAALGFRG